MKAYLEQLKAEIKTYQHEATQLRSRLDLLEQHLLDASTQVAQLLIAQETEDEGDSPPTGTG